MTSRPSARLAAVVLATRSTAGRRGSRVPHVTARVAVEEASTFGWERYTGLQGAVLGMHTFGLSAPMKVVAQHFGFDADHVVSAAKAQVACHRRQSYGPSVTRPQTP
jgi:transketolase